MTGALASAVLLVRKRLVFALLCWAIFLASEGRHGECAVPDAVDGLGRPQVLLHQPEWNRLLKPQAAPQGLETTGSGANEDAQKHTLLFAIGGMQMPTFPDPDDESDVPVKFEEASTPTCEALALCSDVFAARWEIAPSLSLGRRTRHAAIVANETLLVLGGNNGGGPVKTVESLSPWQGTQWVQRAPLSLPRSLAAAAVLGGRVYVTGGCAKGLRESLAAVESSSIGDRRWQTEPSMRQRRSGHAAVVMGGRLYVVGGQGGEDFLNGVESLDVERGEWRAEPDMNTARYGLACVAANGRIYAIGGFEGTRASASLSGRVTALRIASVESLGPADTQWREEPPLPTGRSGHAAVAHNGSIYVLGGAVRGRQRTEEVLVYDIAAQEWAQGPPMQMARMGLAAVVLEEEEEERGEVGGGGRGGGER